MARTVTTTPKKKKSTTTPAWPATVAGRMAFIWQFLTGNMHLSAADASGVEGNWEVESNFDPTAYNPNEGAIGFAQWEGSRRTALQQFAASRGTTETDPVTQLLFFAREIKQRGNLPALKQATDPTAAAYVIQHYFEVSDPSTLGTREADARTAFASASKYGTPHPLAGVGNVTGGSGNGGFEGGVGSVIDVLGGALPSLADAGISSGVGSIMAVVVKLLFSSGGVVLVVLGAKQAAKGSG